MRIIITGATKGIGKAVANIFAFSEHSLALCARNLDDLVKQKSQILETTECKNVFIKPVDVSKKNEVQEFAADVLAEWGAVDLLVNNAGVFIPGEIYREEDGVLEKTIETNVYSAYHLSRAIIPSMIEQKCGHIINISSVAGLKAYPNGGAYSISKFAMLGLGKCLREELKEFGIRVTNVMPGATWSNSWAGVDLPKDRLMEPEDIARIVKVATDLQGKAVLEDVVIRPILGDL
ncbi:SDR family oxidoreductase [Membranihabitans maritimus]|uniref:SDR family oxidoreductase n=1 Tax=Membranihabitans maritimus TaxID=2904244 RepID=UPI001F3D1190|nr:SDR family oxidoreductase [Membranihabitans maritimus]